MISITPISVGELYPLIYLAFKGDEMLLDTYHISPGTLQHCVAHTFDAIDQYRLAEDKPTSEGKVNLFKVELWNEGVTVEIGYVVALLKEDVPANLLSFGINIEYRKPEILKNWMEQLDILLSLPYYTRLYNKNSRAITFFTNNCFIVKEENGYKLLIKYE